MNLFVTGTCTEVGKTVLTAALAAALPGNVRALKVVATGVPEGQEGEDAALLGRAAGHSPRVFRCWVPPLSPHRASEIRGDPVSMSAVQAWVKREAGEHTLVEGVGGWRVPVAWEWEICDLAVALDFPILVAAPNRLGVLNHTLLTVESIRAKGMRVAGVVLNHLPGAPVSPAMQYNFQDLVRLLPGIPVVSFPGLPDLSVDTLARAGKGLIEALDSGQSE